MDAVETNDVMIWVGVDVPADVAQLHQYRAHILVTKHAGINIKRELHSGLVYLGSVLESCVT